jgi:putative ABC transport system permease protein
MHHDLFHILLQRMRSNAWLVGCAAAALMVAVALAVAVPVYAEAASLRLLNEELQQQEARSGRPAFALLVRYLASTNPALEAERLFAVHEPMQGALAELGLPLLGYARHARTATMPLALPAERQALLDVSLGFVSGMDEQFELVEGRLPQPASTLDQPLEVLASRAFAERVGLNPGVDLVAIGRAAGQSVSIPVRIVGLWQPRTPDHTAWFYPPESFDEVLLMPEASFSGPLASTLSGEVVQALWFARLDGSGLNAANANALAGRMGSLQATVAARLPGSQLEQSPAGALASYRSASAALSTQLALFGTPLFALLVAFLMLVGGLLLARQQGEIALLKTRGVGDGQIACLLAFEWLLLAGMALLCGPPLGLVFASIMARTSSFLRFDPNLPRLSLALTAEHLLFGGAAISVALLAVLWPAAQAARRTLLDTQRQAARPDQAPFWQRRWLDLLLLPVPLYGLYQLRMGDGLTFNGASGRELTANPLLALLPALFSLSLALLLLRLLPSIWENAVRIVAARSNGAVLLVALQFLARQPGAYRAALLTLMLTLSTALWSTAVAAALDDGLHSSIGYSVGADAQLLETGQSTEGLGSDGQPQRRDVREEPRFLFVPVSAHLGVPGIEAASPVGRYSGQLPGGRKAQLVGIDRLSLPQVLRGFDPAWADGLSLGELMNRLAAYPNGVLVSRDLLQAGLKLGDTVAVQAEMAGDRRTIELVIVGVVDLFPGLYPQEGPLLITHLHGLFDQMGGQYPYDVWIACTEGADWSAIAAGVRALGIDLVDIRATSALIREEQARPQRQGLFGLLSVGFLATGLLSVLGLLTSIVMNARRRMQELGVLRALGLAQQAAVTVLLVEHLLVVGVGLLAGTLLGSSSALLIVPALEAGSGSYPATPPIAPRLPLDDMALLALASAAGLLLALAGLAVTLRRMQLFTIVKMGD